MYRSILLAVSGVLFLLYPVFRPWADETTDAGAHEAMGSTAWVLAHLFAMIGFILVPIALLGLRDRVGTAPAVIMWIGAGLTLPYYGAEDFGLHAVATNDGDLLGIAEAVRYQPIAVTMFAAGLLTLAAGAIVLAVRATQKVPAIVFAAGFVLFLPQFFTPAPVRIAHGVLMLVGLVWLAASVREPQQVLSGQRAA